MATKTDSNGNNTDNGTENLRWDELKLIAPDLFQEFLQRKAKSELMGKTVTQVSAAIHNAAAALAAYRDAYAELQAEVALLKEKGGYISDIPEYRQYRTDNGQPVTAKGKPTNMEMVVQHFMTAAAE